MIWNFPAPFRDLTGAGSGVPTFFCISCHPSSEFV